MKKRVWNNTVSKHCNNQIKVFKVPHHGTKAYFCKNFPQAEELLISNEKHFNWDITALYPQHYDTSNFSCTNNSGCEFYVGTSTRCQFAKECGCANKFSIERTY